MFAPANQSSFNLTIEGVEHDFQVSAFTGHEAISQPFTFDVQLVSENSGLDLEALLHKPAFLQVAPDGSGIHGLIYRAAQGDSGKRLTHYAVTLRPLLSYLAHSTQQRIFQNLSVPEIIAQVLEQRAIFSNAYRFNVGADYPKRVYCVQYDESDLHFVQRLCEEEGIHYHFQHSKTDHLLVFGDDYRVFPKLAPVPYKQPTGMVAETPVIQRFNLRVETRPTCTTRRDYDFAKPRLTLESAEHSGAQPTLEDYDYPGRFTDRARGSHLAKRALEAHRSDFQLAEGSSDQPLLVSGHFLALTQHPNGKWNDLWLLTELRHEGHQPQVLEESSPEGAQQGYRNSFTATPWEVPYRPPLMHPKPRVLGSQSAFVTGPKGEEIHCDEHGRVKVQFHWDRQGNGDDRSSCWLRVSSAWAGPDYGGIAIPRVGMEVLVTFLEGDPDQPVISGCLYHGENLPPYSLPANKTRSTFKTRSSPGGGGYNELRIEDRKGAEQIFVHAQRDWQQHIGHNQNIHVGNERHDSVEGNSYSEFNAEEHCVVHGDRKVEARANDHLTVTNSQHVRAGSGIFIEAGQEIHLRSGMKMVIEAGLELTIKAGGHFLKIDPGGITTSQPITLGMYAGSGTGATPMPPTPPEPANTALPGYTPAKAPKNNPTTEEALNKKGPESLIVDVWGDPGLGGQVQLLEPEDKP